jgi:hypothetical protein
MYTMSLASYQIRRSQGFGSALNQQVLLIDTRQRNDMDQTPRIRSRKKKGV